MITEARPLAHRRLRALTGRAGSQHNAVRRVLRLGRHWLLLCVLLVVSDPMLRHREAAHDLALSLAEVGPGAERNVFEPVDEEPLDQPGHAIVKACQATPLADALAIGDASPDFDVLRPGPSVAHPEPARPHRQARPPERTSRRLSLLQRLLT
jgi:hypothetical protein